MQKRDEQRHMLHCSINPPIRATLAFPFPVHRRICPVGLPTRRAVTLWTPADMAQNTQTPPETLEAATDKAALPNRRLTLIGTYEKAGGDTALIRMADGNFSMVATGDTIGAATITAIETGMVRLTLGAHSARLTLPEG
ncbi:MAG: hypothetical protein P1U83_17535 [Roseovarius sp.]|nr:hypothetical protein [Roseovarius sp.]